VEAAVNGAAAFVAAVRSLSPSCWQGTRGANIPDLVYDSDPIFLLAYAGRSSRVVGEDQHFRHWVERGGSGGRALPYGFIR
jgi:hypothetical protein